MIAETGHYALILALGVAIVQMLLPLRATTEAGIHASWRGDLYTVLGDQLKDGAYSIRLYFNPLVRLIWLGALVMFFGGAVSLSDRRLRVGAPKRAQAKAAPAAAGK